MLWANAITPQHDRRTAHTPRVCGLHGYTIWQYAMRCISMTNIFRALFHVRPCARDAIDASRSQCLAGNSQPCALVCIDSADRKADTWAGALDSVAHTSHARILNAQTDRTRNGECCWWAACCGWCLRTVVASTAPTIGRDSQVSGWESRDTANANIDDWLIYSFNCFLWNRGNIGDGLAAAQTYQLHTYPIRSNPSRSFMNGGAWSETRTHTSPRPSAALSARCVVVTQYDTSSGEFSLPH